MLIVGDEQPPYRKPAGGIVRCSHGSMFKHGRFNDVGIARYINSTLVRNTDDTADVPPYERYVDDGFCDDPAACDSCGSPITGAWGLPFALNAFSHSGSKDFKQCKKIGHKEVQVRRSWHGRFGFTSHDAPLGGDGSHYSGWSDQREVCATSTPIGTPPGVHCGTGTLKCDDGEAPAQYTADGYGPVYFCNDGSTPTCVVSEKSWESYQQNPDRIKFCRITATATVTASFPDWVAEFGPADPSWEWDLSYSRYVDPITSLTVLDSYSESQYGRRNIFESLVGSYAVTEAQVRDVLRNMLPNIDCIYTLVSFAVTGLILTNHSIIATAEASYHSTHGPHTPGTASIAIQIGFTEPNLDQYVRDDAKDLLDLWPLNDDKIYPFRTDDKLQMAPLVSRRERSNYDNFSGYTDLLILDYQNPQTDPFGRAYDPDPDLWTPTFLSRVNTDVGSGEYLLGRDCTDILDGDVVDTHFGGGNNVVTRTVLASYLPSGVTYDSATGHLSGTASIPYAATFGNFYILIKVTVREKLDGKILGMPLPRALNDSNSAIYNGGGNPDGAYEDFFDFAFVDYYACVNDPEIYLHPFSWYVYGSGNNVTMFNSQNGTQIPATATQWTNRRNSINKPPGAFETFADRTLIIRSFHEGTAMDNMTYWAGKYAEILDTWPSGNFARPAGADKFLLDETTVVAVGDDFDGTNFTAYSYETGSYAAKTAFAGIGSGLWGGLAVDGFYSGCSFSAGQVHLGTKVYDIPSDWKSASYDTGVCFGKLRFDTAPSLLGRVGISAINDSNGNTPFSTTATAGQRDDHGRAPGDPGFTTLIDWVPTYLFDDAQTAFGLTTATHQENIDLCQFDMTVLSNQTATRIDDYTFTVPLPINAKYILIHGAPAKWYENDNTPKGDFLVRNWTHDVRTKQEDDRLAPLTDCSSTPVTRPTSNQGGGPVDCLFLDYDEQQLSLPAVPCSPRVFCISPNEGDVFENGITMLFPGVNYGGIDPRILENNIRDFAFDERYGSMWQGQPVVAMNDVFYQAPHKAYAFSDPLTELDYDPSDPTESLRWNPDDVSCQQDSVEVLESGNLIFHVYYAHPPLIEARNSIPSNYGPLQNETAPSLPAGIDILMLSPVHYNSENVAYPPSWIGFKPIAIGGVDGGPAGIDTFSALHQRFCDAPGNESCERFDYTNFALNC